MKLIRVRAKGKGGNVVFDQDAGVKNGKPARVVIRANGNVHQVDGALKVVKEALERGDLISLEPAEETQGTKAEK